MNHSTILVYWQHGHVWTVLAMSGSSTTWKQAATQFDGISCPRAPLDHQPSGRNTIHVVRGIRYPNQHLPWWVEMLGPSPSSRRSLWLGMLGNLGHFWILQAYLPRPCSGKMSPISGLKCFRNIPRPMGVPITTWEAVGLITGVNADSDQFYVDFQQARESRRLTIRTWLWLRIRSFSFKGWFCLRVCLHLFLSLVCWRFVLMFVWNCVTHARPLGVGPQTQFDVTLSLYRTAYVGLDWFLPCQFDGTPFLTIKKAKR